VDAEDAAAQPPDRADPEGQQDHVADSQLDGDRGREQEVTLTRGAGVVQRNRGAFTLRGRSVRDPSRVAPTVVSPHLDDAVLSCWHVLEAHRPASVVNVFDGAPPAGGPAAWWDRTTGASDSAARMRERHREDRAALACAGARARGLGLLDGQYRPGPVAMPDLVDRLDAALPPDAVLHAPAGLDGHPDHVVVRDAAVRLTMAGPRTLVLYADLPHGIARGWPGWVTGGGDRPGSGDPWTAALARSGLVVERLEARIHRLAPPAHACKLRALDAYATQRAALDAMAFVPLADPRALAFEVTWTVPRSAVRGLEQAGGQTVVPRARREPLDGRA
jgi:LmbE family N-acetylglucosaminyl deacetylase